MTLAKAGETLVLFTVCAALASSLGTGLSSCGGGSSGGRPSATGGSGAGGAGGGSTGTGGSLACTIPLVDHGALTCSPGVSPAIPLLTDFTEATWHNTEGKWGCGFTGALYSYAGPKSTMKDQINTMAHNFQLTGMVGSGDYAGGGLSFGECVNTTVYTGVQFTLGGMSGGCDVYLQVQTYDAQGAANGGGCDPNKGGTGCYIFPQFKLATTTGQINVHFSDLTGGKPMGAAAIAAEIVGLQWQLQSPPPPDGGLQASCENVGLTITDVKFVP